VTAVHPVGRDLDERELLELVCELSGRPDVWAPRIPDPAGGRAYEELIREQHLSVWLIAWDQGGDTGFHDHDLSSGAVGVIEGGVREDRLVLAGFPTSRVVKAGGAFSFSASDIHRVTHAGRGPALTLHAYSPPLWRMGAYEVTDDGGLRRHSISYAEELRPLSSAAA
jgi:predicted metal-dependent enzyme (double-stranded beta helix superfamily)